MCLYVDSMDVCIHHKHPMIFEVSLSEIDNKIKKLVDHILFKCRRLNLNASGGLCF